MNFIICNLKDCISIRLALFRQLKCCRKKGGGGARQRIDNEQSCSCLLACLLSYFDFIQIYMLN